MSTTNSNGSMHSVRMSPDSTGGLVFTSVNQDDHPAGMAGEKGEINDQDPAV